MTRRASDLTQRTYEPPDGGPRILPPPQKQSICDSSMQLSHATYKVPLRYAKRQANSGMAPDALDQRRGHCEESDNGCSCDASHQKAAPYVCAAGHRHDTCFCYDPFSPRAATPGRALRQAATTLQASSAVEVGPRPNEQRSLAQARPTQHNEHDPGPSRAQAPTGNNSGGVVPKLGQR